MKKYLALFVATIPLVACGGGSDGPAGRPHVEVDYIGDSIVNGVSWNGTAYVQLSANAPQDLQDDFHSQGFGYVDVMNNGVPGATTDSTLNGTGVNKWPLSTTLANDSNARVVIVSLGVNDAYATPPATYTSNLGAIVSAIRAAGKIPVLEEPNPICNSTQQSTNLDAIVSALDSYASANSVTLVSQYAYIKTLSWQSMLPDCIHPNAALYKIKADRVNSVVQSMLSTL